MKTPNTVRAEAEFLATARQCAPLENRTLTKAIHTALRRRIKPVAAEGAAGSRPARYVTDDGSQDDA